MSEINKHYRQIKTALRKHNPVDPYFVSRYSFSPYMACQHACKYCDGRAERYYVEGDYEKDIIIRDNLIEVLSLELTKVKEIGTVTIGSGISDPYQPVEKTEQIMKKSAQLLIETDLSATILTKSALILRDLDIWDILNQKNGSLLMVSITTLDDRIRKIFEPGASSVDERLNAMATFKKAGIPVGALMMPLLPGITDDKQSISNLLKTLKNMNIDFVLPGGLTLRPGKQKAVYLNVIRTHYPHLEKLYNDMYSGEFPSGAPFSKYSKTLFNNYNTLLSKFQIPDRIPHYIYQDRFPLYDEIYILLHHLHHLYKLKHIDTTALKIATKKYSVWLKEEKRSFARKKKKSHNILEERFVNLIISNKLNNIIENHKLSNFIEKVTIERKKFDYINLKLK